MGCEQRLAGTTRVWSAFCLPSPSRRSTQYLSSGGGAGLAAARAVEPDVVIAEVEASGLRGRGGAGFPTGTKWRTVAAYGSSVLATTVVVNAAEGEPGTFKDRAILRANPYAVLEGALIAAHAVGANEIVFATKARFVEELRRVRSAVDELTSAGWTKDVAISIVEGPSEYLYGEETALLEVIDGRPPFPRIAPPYRRGVVEVLTDDDVDSESGLAADVEMATADDETLAPPVLANNVETLANVPAIIENGAGWFRSVGTPESPGTIVVTLTGDVLRPGVGEVAMGSRCGCDRGRRRRRCTRSLHRRSARRCVDRGAHRRPSRRRPQLRGDGRGGLGARLRELPRHRQRGRRDRARGRRVAIPRDRVVWTVHSVQAGRARHRERPLVPLPRGRDRERRSTRSEAPWDGRGRRTVQPRPTARDRRRKPARRVPRCDPGPPRTGRAAGRASARGRAHRDRRRHRGRGRDVPGQAA